LPDPPSVFQTVPRIVMGPDSVRGLGDEVRRLGGRRVAVITDPGLVRAGLHEPALYSLRRAGLEPALFQEVSPDPPLEIIPRSTVFVRESRADLIVGLGGGSSLDVAKATAIGCTNPGPMEAYAGVNLVPRPGLPTVLIPTTAGTGSEATCVAVLSDTANKVKIGVFSEFLFARLALLDPRLTLGLPAAMTAATGLDALIHALESYTGRQATFLTEPLALAALELAARYLRRACADGSDLEARTGMLRASLLAGMAFTNTQCAAAHACSMALGGAFHIPHGVATALMLPAAMRFNLPAAPEKFSRIAQIFGEPTAGLAPLEAAAGAITAIERLIRDLDVKLGLENYGVDPAAVPGLARAALGLGRLWRNNPRTADQEEVEGLFRDSFTNPRAGN